MTPTVVTKRIPKKVFTKEGLPPTHEAVVMRDDTLLPAHIGISSGSTPYDDLQGGNYVGAVRK